MAAPYHPAYRLTVKAPRSVDATEATTLVPIGGAAHSDPFVVASIQGVGGAKPYLWMPDGWQGSFDPVSKNVTVGTRAVSIQDQRVTAGGSNAVRWVTAFFGDAAGRLRLKGCKAILEESLDGGSTWATIFTGRIGNVTLDGLLKVSLELKSSAEDLKKQIFVYDPLPSVSYAFRSAIYPPRPVKSWGAGTIPAQPWIKGTISDKYTTSVGAVRCAITVDTSQFLKELTLDTKQSYAYTLGTAGLLVTLKVTAGGATGSFRIRAGNSNLRHRVHFTEPGTEHWYEDKIGELEELPSTHALYLAMPVNGTAITFYAAAIDQNPISASNPVFIDDVHPLQFFADILDGKFSIPNADLSARPIAPRDTSAAGPWDYTNASSPSFSMSDLPKQRFIVAGPSSAADWIVKKICQPFHLTYRFDGQGRVVPVDLRVTSATAVTGAIVDADLVELPTKWGLDGSRALLGANVTFYVDIPKPSTALRASPDVWPDIGAQLVDSIQQPLLVINPNAVLARDAGDTITNIDAQGIRLIQNEFAVTDPGQLLAIDKLSKCKTAMYEMLAAFAGGAVTVDLKLRRASTAGQNVQPGQFWTITASSLPDPATNQRGGARVGLCLSRTEQELSVLATFLDVGSATPANVPTVGTLALANNGLDIPITVNAASDPVQVEYIITKAGTAVRPIATDPGWTHVGDQLIANGTARQPSVPANTRLWVRARSRPSGTGLKLPSAYVFPAGGAPAGSIDVAAITAPSAVGHSGVTGSRALIAWTVGDATMAVEVFLTTGGVPGTWTDDMRQTPTLPAGSSKQLLTRLLPSQAYAVGIRHRDNSGGTSAFATDTFATGATATVLTIPPAPAIGGGTSGGSGSGLTLPLPKRPIPVGVALLLFPADPSANFEIQRAPDLAGAPNVGAAGTITSDVPGNSRVYHDEQPLDGAQRWYRVRHVGFTDTASGYSDWTPGTPIVQPPQGPTNAIASPLNAQSRFRCHLRNSINIAIVTAALTFLTWDTEDYDVGALHDLITNPSRITIPAGGDNGVWLLAAGVDWGANAAGYRNIVIIKNGAVAIAASTIAPAPAGIGTEHSVFAFDDKPAVGDYYELRVSQTSGGNLNVTAAQSSFFSATHVW